MISQPSGSGNTGTEVDNHPVILHARVNDITLVSRNSCFGMAKYCFRNASLGPNPAAFFYIKLPLVLNYDSIPVVLNISGFTANRKLWFFKHNRKHAPAVIKRTAHKTFIRPIVEYASIV